MIENKRKHFMSKLSIVSVVILMSITLLMSGCGQKPGQSEGQESQNPDSGQNDEHKPDISAKPAETSTKVTLYFGDKEGMYLLPVEREITKGNETLESAIIAELIKGLQDANLSRTIPEGTKLLSVSVVDGVAYVNFSKEFQTKHWGGSTGETMTIYSVVNSLGSLAGIQKVQFLLEGDKKDSIFGHNDTSTPFSPDWNLSTKQDSGRYIGQVDSNSIEIRISGVPDSIDPKVFRLSDDVKTQFNSYNLKTNDQIKFTYQENAHGQAVIVQISRI